MLEFLNKIFDWIPGRKEHRRNKIEKLYREQEEILTRPSTPANAARLDSIAKQLRILEGKAING